MPNMPRLGLAYPAKDQRPWFDIFERWVNGIDAAMYAHREDRNLVLEGGGTISWSKPSLSWTADIYLVSPYTGYAMTLPTSESPVDIEDGQALYVEMVRSLPSNTNVTPKVTTALPSDNNAFLLAIRRGDVLYFRNGRGFNDGQSGSLYVQPASGVPISGWARHQVTVVSNNDLFVGKTQTAALQTGLADPGDAFGDALSSPESLAVFYNNALCHYVTGAPSTVNEWRWITTGAPNPVIEIGPGSLTGNIVTVQYPI